MNNPAFEHNLEDDQGTSKETWPLPIIPPDKLYSYEEAVTLSGTGKFHYFLFMVSGLCLMEVFLESLSVTLTLPFIKCDLDPTIAEESLLISAYMIGMLLSSQGMGFLADAWGRLKTLRFSLVFCFITTVCSAFSTNIWMLIVLRLLNGIFVSGCQAAAYSFMGEFHGQKTRVMYVSLMAVFFALATIFFPAIAMEILPMKINATFFGLELKPWRVFFLAISALSLLILCGLGVTPESPKFVLIQGEHDKALETLRKLFKINTGRPESEYPVKNIYTDVTGVSLNNVNGLKDGIILAWRQTAQLFFDDRALNTLNMFCIVFIANCIYQGTLLWFPTIMHQLYNDSHSNHTVCQTMLAFRATQKNVTNSRNPCNNGPVKSGEFNVLMLAGIAFTIIYLLMVSIIDYVGQKNLLVAWLFVLAAFGLVIQWSTSYYFSMILLTFMLSIGSCSGIVSSVAIEYYPTNISGMAMCLTMMMSTLGAAIGGIFVGPALLTNCDLLFYIYDACILFLVYLAMYLPYKSEQSSSRGKNGCL